MKIGTKHQKQGRDENPIHISFRDPNVSINRAAKPSTFYLLAENDFKKKIKFKNTIPHKISHEDTEQKNDYLEKSGNYKKFRINDLTSPNAKPSSSRILCTENSLHSKENIHNSKNSIFYNRTSLYSKKYITKILSKINKYGQLYNKNNTILNNSSIYSMDHDFSYKYKVFLGDIKSNRSKKSHYFVSKKNSNINYTISRKYSRHSSFIQPSEDNVPTIKNTHSFTKFLQKHPATTPYELKKYLFKQENLKKLIADEPGSSSFSFPISSNKLRSARSQFTPIPYQTFANAPFQLHTSRDAEQKNFEVFQNSSDKFNRSEPHSPRYTHVERSIFAHQKSSATYQPSINEFADAVTLHLVNELSAAPAHSTLSWPQATPSYPGWHT
ncbi:hypothetical protein [Acetobacter sp. DsW_063]|uniref:hypothetical protein n=1 Tax=Acetobacter sp. DsW_063 TaxID=1514894 RepID=UPI0013025453|nr:hypothetical protein [Acetobacter sp. DsW_063]